MQIAKAYIRMFETNRNIQDYLPGNKNNSHKLITENCADAQNQTVFSQYNRTSSITTTIQDILLYIHVLIASCIGHEAQQLSFTRKII
jgi:hypothetical protein